MACTSETGGVLGRIGAGVGEATGCGNSGCGADNASTGQVGRGWHTPCGGNFTKRLQAMAGGNLYGEEKGVCPERSDIALSAH
ncbi:hypothetical protein EYF80_030090 [Liparis tanakae]|uniref:Uncharacterized protein n=1 Tax=Liparis tanakae TaxID=230148 RepID=A0A4Z2H1S3_9TELE|nr:hypothetical protein EYF80_030090 [Liparis tanakae]